MNVNVTTIPNVKGDRDGGDDGERQIERVQCKCAFKGALRIKSRRQEGARAIMEDEEDEEDTDEEGGGVLLLVVSIRCAGWHHTGAVSPERQQR